MGSLRVILGDQLSHSLSALDGLDPARDTVLMMEVMGECEYVPHHPQKITLILSAMRHFRDALAARGVPVRYVALDDPDNTGTLSGEVERAARALRPDRVVATEPGEWRVLQDMRGWEAALGVEVEIRADDRFLCPLPWFRHWAEGRRELRMEFFYREMRRQSGLLMEGDKPVGGQWNYDSENRRRLPRGLAPPPAPRFPPDATTREVMALVAARFSANFGDLDGFNWPVTAVDARAALEAFIAQRLSLYGDYQDAMATGQATLFHALISTSLNCGLLSPREACDAAESAYHAGTAPL
ncbi:MAG: cryptochrome/photolyase family protein, partial [Rubritepida sp.]|nr:cryptochrome/photolyase family protein [Rubritepida sp.]